MKILMIPTVPAKEFEKFGFNKCAGKYGKAGCYYLCMARENKMLFVSDEYFSIEPRREFDPRRPKQADYRSLYYIEVNDIMYDLIIFGMLKTRSEMRGD